jgi:hypothetical protein
VSITLIKMLKNSFQIPFSHYLVFVEAISVKICTLQALGSDNYNWRIISNKRLNCLDFLFTRECSRTCIIYFRKPIYKKCQQLLICSQNSGNTRLYLPFEIACWRLIVSDCYATLSFHTVEPHAVETSLTSSESGDMTLNGILQRAGVCVCVALWGVKLATVVNDSFTYSLCFFQRVQCNFYIFQGINRRQFTIHMDEK